MKTFRCLRRCQRITAVAGPSASTFDGFAHVQHVLHIDFSQVLPVSRVPAPAYSGLTDREASEPLLDVAAGDLEKGERPDHVLPDDASHLCFLLYALVV